MNKTETYGSIFKGCQDRARLVAAHVACNSGSTAQACKDEIMFEESK